MAGPPPGGGFAPGGRGPSSAAVPRSLYPNGGGSSTGQ
jgi:hypothetical protein